MTNKKMEKDSEFPVWLFESRILKYSWANTNVALVYSYMLARYRFHNNSNRGYFESYEYIAEKVGLSVRTVKKVVSLLKNNNHLEIKKRRGPSGISNVYIIQDIYKTWELNKSKLPSSQSEKASKKPSGEGLSLREMLDLEMQEEVEQIILKDPKAQKSKEKFHDGWGIPEHMLPPWERSMPKDGQKRNFTRHQNNSEDDESDMPF